MIEKKPDEAAMSGPEPTQKTALLSEAIRQYHAGVEQRPGKAGKISKAERKRRLQAFDELMAKIPPRP